MNLKDYYLNIPALKNVPILGKMFSAPKPLSPSVPNTQRTLSNTSANGDINIFKNPNYSDQQPVSQPSEQPIETAMPEQTPAPAAMEMMQPQMTKKQMKTNPALYDAAQEMGRVYGIDPNSFLANSRWEHRGTPAWEQGKFNSNIWWDESRNTGEASYGPYQINMRYFGPEAVKLGRITTDHPLYIDEAGAMDPYASTKWQAKKWAREQKAGITDMKRLYQLHNSNEEGRGDNVQKIIDESEFIRSEE